MPCEGTAVATAPDSSAGIRVQDKDSVMEVDDVPKFVATCSFGVPLVKTYRRPGDTAAATAPGPSAGTRPSWAEVRK